jgi:hypothetical protein
MRLLIWVAFSALLEARSGLNARFQVIVIGEEPYAQQIRAALSHDLERIDGVSVVAKQPDYILAVNFSLYRDQKQELIALHAESAEVLEDSLAERIFLKGDAEMESMKWISQLLRRTDHLAIRIGTLARLPSICAEIVREINDSTLINERMHPRREAKFDDVFTNFMKRSGAIGFTAHSALMP